MNVYQGLQSPLAMIIFSLTLLLPILIGFFTLKKTKNQSDYLLGGRSMNKFVVALSAVSSGRSSWLVLGLSGMAYSMGTGALWAAVGYIVVELFQFIYIGKKLREDTQTFQSITLLDYLESRHNDSKHIIRITGAIIIGVFITAYVAAQLNAGAKALSTALDLQFIPALLVSVLLILVYMIMGGFIAVAYNDVVRAVIMIFGLVFFPLVVLIKTGGLNHLFTMLASIDIKTIDPFSIGVGAMIGFIGIGLGSPGQPHILVRYMSVKDPAQLRYSAIVGTIWNILMAWGALFIGLLGRMLFPLAQQLPDSNPEMIYLVLSSQYFGPVIYGLLIGGIFAAILSTADSQLLVVASTIVRDIYEKIWFKHVKLDESFKLKISRIVVLLSGLLAVVLAYLAQDLIFWLVLFAWSGLGASIGPAIILSLYWKRTTIAGVTAGMITGSVVTIIWKLFLKTSTGLYELIPAFFLAFFMIWAVSLLTAKNINE